MNSRPDEVQKSYKMQGAIIEVKQFLSSIIQRKSTLKQHEDCKYFSRVLFK